MAQGSNLWMLFFLYSHDSLPFSLCLLYQENKFPFQVWEFRWLREGIVLVSLQEQKCINVALTQILELDCVHFVQNWAMTWEELSYRWLWDTSYAARDTTVTFMSMRPFSLRNFFVLASIGFHYLVQVVEGQLKEHIHFPLHILRNRPLYFQLERKKRVLNLIGNRKRE